MPIEKFHTETYNQEEKNLLEYVISIANQIAPDIDFDALGQPCILDSQAPHLFKLRYNAGTLNVQLTYEDYTRRDHCNNDSVINIINALGIDADKFWYLLLFVSDYVSGSTVNTIKCDPTPKEQIEKLINFITDNEESVSPIYGIRHKQPISLTLWVKGHRLIIRDPETLSIIAAICRDGLLSISDMVLLNSTPIEFNPYNKSGSIKKWLFADIFYRFFKLYPQFTSKRRTGNETSKSVSLLISKLIYITKLTSNSDYFYEVDNLRGLLKQYRNYKIDTINSIYG